MPVSAEDLALSRQIASRMHRRRAYLDPSEMESDAALGLATAVGQWDASPAIRARFAGRREAYVTRVVARAVIDGLRARGGRQGQKLAPVTEAVRLDTDGPDFHEWLVTSEDDTSEVIVADQLDRLPPRQADIVRRTVLEGETMVAVAAEQGVTPSWIQSLRDQALASLAADHARSDPRADADGWAVAPARRRNHTHTGDLTLRELQVLHAASLGWADRDIAAMLGLGIETVKTHKKTMLSKLDAVTTAHAVAIAYERTLLPR